MKHVIVAKNDGFFYGWPANNGMWIWDNEIVIGFTEGRYKNMGSDKHAIDADAPKRSCFARSIDGGETWSLEYPVFNHPDKEKLLSFPPDDANDERYIPSCPGGYNFNAPGFAMKFFYMGTPAPSRSWFYITTDRWRTWTGPWRVPTFGLTGLSVRTDYLIEDDNTLLCAMTGVKSSGFEGNSFAARLCDGGSKWEQLGFIGDKDPVDSFRIMPSIQRLDDGSLFAMTRFAGEKAHVEKRSCRMECYKSFDEGVTWILASSVAQAHAGTNGNPPASAKLADGRVLMVYGQRFEPLGMVAMTTHDGVSWSDKTYLRQDAESRDLGYPRVVIRPDGCAVAAYYYNTDANSERFIAATIFKP